MRRDLFVEAERFPLATAFTISRGSKTEAAVLTCTIRMGDVAGRGECVPYARYGETLENVQEAIEAAREEIVGSASREELLAIMKPGAARNAVDCALWDLEARQTGQRVADKVCPGGVRPLTTAYTISLGEPDE